YDYAAMAGWAKSPLVATALALLIVSTFWHARLGLQVLVEDYVPKAGSRFAVLLLLNLAAVGGAMFGLVSIARIALSGAA
ncbi:MAG TPA: succinate dehydrogenase, hydrophobic membrane anchor protein, partial [Qipengyuania sp.]|nr:succinate dehydrogenase, hydrophobic membrane anchor protein [Qipengyuania sp.]